MLQSDLIHLAIFKELSHAQYDVLKSILEPCRHGKGFVIFEQHQTASYFFILLKGEVIIKHKPYDGPAITVTHIHPGEVFGWSAAMGKETYTSTAVAQEDINLFRLHRHDLQMLRKNHPDVCDIFLERISNLIADRVHDTHREVLSILTNSIDTNGNIIEE